MYYMLTLAYTYLDFELNFFYIQLAFTLYPYFRQVSTGKLLNVKFDLTWDACTKYFDFDTDLHPDVLCDAMAREKWSRKFFDDLQT